MLGEQTHSLESHKMSARPYLETIFTLTYRSIMVEFNNPEKTGKHNSRFDDINPLPAPFMVIRNFVHCTRSLSICIQIEFHVYAFPLAASSAAAKRWQGNDSISMF
jgi:hypothetical protein